MEEKKGISRRGFLRTAAVVSAALTVNPAYEKVMAATGVGGNNKSSDDAGMATVSAQRTLGKGNAAFTVSALGFGVMGMTYNRSQHPDKKACIRLLHEAIDRGVTLFDTAIIYGPLTNEVLAGEALSDYKNKVNVTTKFGHEVIDGKGTGRQDSRPATIRRYCEDSLRRLRLDSIPMFYQHRFDPNVSAEEVAATIADLIKDPNNDNRQTLPRFQPEAMRANMRIVNVLQAFGRTRGMTSTQVALGWLLQKAPWIVPIPGTTKLAHLEENLRTLQFSCTPEEWKELEDAVAAIPVIGDRYNAEQQKQIGH